MLKKGTYLSVKYLEILTCARFTNAAKVYNCNEILCVKKYLKNKQSFLQYI